MRKLTLLVLVPTLILGGCSTTPFSTLQNTDTSQQVIYTIPEEQAIQIARTVLATTLPKQEIEVIDGPVRGFSSHSQFGVDFFTHKILVYAAIGTSLGKPVRGYYFEVFGSGTTFKLGQAQNLELFKKLERELRATSKRVEVTGIARIPYENAKWR